MTSRADIGIYKYNDVDKNVVLYFSKRFLLMGDLDEAKYILFNIYYSYKYLFRM